MPVPVLRMGLVGFADESHLRNLLMARSHGLLWRHGPFLEADALWLNGACAQPMRNHQVRISMGDASGTGVLINVRELDRPFAFARPLANGYLGSHPVFDPRAAQSVADVLHEFEAMLRDHIMRLSLGSEIARRRYELASPIYHLSLEGKLVAVVTVHGDIGIHPELSPMELVQAEWSGRPAAARDMPPGFERTSMAHVMWDYVMQSGDDLLPSRYRNGPVYFRRMPAVSPRLLETAHLRVISVLREQPMDVERLGDATKLERGPLSQALAALYFAGSITTDAKRAMTVRRDRPAPRSGYEVSRFAQQADERTAQDFRTVPTPLEDDRR